MHRLITLSILAAFPTVLFAYNPIVVDPPAAYESIPIEGDIYTERSYLGDLENAPDLYEFTTDVAVTVRFSLAQAATDEAVPYGILMVRQNEADGAVTEIIRQNQPLPEWKKDYRHDMAMSFLMSDVIEKDVTPGTYRIEVSTPDNNGAYMLTIGEDTVRPSYVAMIRNIFRTQSHFGVFPLLFLFSPYVYSVLGIALGVYVLYRYRKNNLHTHA